MNPIDAKRQPYFKRGERVKVYIPGWPTGLGEYTVLDVKQEVTSGIFVYRLSDGRQHADGTPIFWKEPVLKKVYDLSEFIGFAELMIHYGGTKYV